MPFYTVHTPPEGTTAEELRVAIKCLDSALRYAQNTVLRGLDDIAKIENDIALLQDMLEPVGVVN